MSATADAYMQAIDLAFPNLTPDERERLTARYMVGNASPAEIAAIRNKFHQIAATRIVVADVLDKVAAGVQSDLDGDMRRCCDCSGWFDGPGPRCPVCTDKRNEAGEANDLQVLRAAGVKAVDAIEAAMLAVDEGKATLPDKVYEGLWDAMIGLKNELPKA